MSSLEANEGGPPADPDRPQTDPATSALVKRWLKKIKGAREYHKGAFDRMRLCQQLARDGGDTAWVTANKYVVPIVNRHINQSVSQLYAKNPKVYARRKPRRMFTVWDGKLTSLQEAAQQIAAGTQAMATGVVDPTMAQSLMNAQAVLQDAMGVKQYNTMMDGLSDTLTLLHNHYISEKSAQYKQQFKALVRRTKVNGVGYVKLAFQRILNATPDLTAKANDVTEQISRIERLMAAGTRNEIEEDSPDLEELRAMLQDIEGQIALIVQEGPMLLFPHSTRIIIDPQCTHLKTLTGAGWLAEEYDFTPEKIEETYKVDVRSAYEKYQPQDDRAKVRHIDGEERACDLARVWRVECRETGQEFTVCDGYSDWLKPPAPPDVKLTRFFTVFPLVFNECEHEDEIFPPSDVFQARHIQREYNRARDGLREHRIANKPAYIGFKSDWDEGDVQKLATHAANEILLLNQGTPGEAVDKKLMTKPTVPIDAALYEVEGLYADLQRTVGTQQANLGGTSGDTATETSIAEQSRTVSLNDNVDDLDDLLSLLADSMGELMLRELTPETVLRIVGPGAVWPEAPETREEIIEDIILDIRAGSSGKPNQAAEVAKMERAMPTILQLPNVNPVPIAEKYFATLELDVDDAVVEGLPSITAMNAMMTKAMAGSQPATGDPSTDPNQQGGKGGDNAQKPAQDEPQSQPAYPAPAPSPAA